MSAFSKFLTSASVALVALCMSKPAYAQYTVGPLAGAPTPSGTATDDSSALQLSRPQCLHRETDERPSIRPDDKLLTIWLSVPQKTVLGLAGWGTAIGNRWGELKITLLVDGIVVGESKEGDLGKGTGVIRAKAATYVTIFPGRQHKLTARPEALNKTLLGFEMHASIKGGCS